MNMHSFSSIIRGLRSERGLLLREVTAAVGIDPAIVSKFEKGERRPNREQVLAFEKFYDTKPDELLIAWLSDKVASQLENEGVAFTALQIAEKKIRYNRESKSVDVGSDDGLYVEGVGSSLVVEEMQT
jgi:transcriptional regulator with XRE-family HTH domain